ncbi:MAG: hypothetical protein DI563_29060 [Variovorax paradoxus]|uniref:Uncharacterized protein n=1 Tax=Variovorax paradoxus TaxID=34073 RepID=A0A2W5P6H2_VARPD|nr:MAG: hypothetical protein DI563_29060 [Variovorax paradoxus]
MAAARPPEPCTPRAVLLLMVTGVLSSVAWRSSATLLASARPLRSNSPTKPPPMVARPPAVLTSVARLSVRVMLLLREVAFCSQMLLAAAAPPTACT